MTCSEDHFAFGIQPGSILELPSQFLYHRNLGVPRSRCEPGTISVMMKGLLEIRSSRADQLSHTNLALADRNGGWGVTWNPVTK
jgi:hypothetical protein